MKKIFLLISLSIFVYLSGHAQKRDYSTIQFKSKLREYTKTLPKTKENNITKSLFQNLVEILSQNKFTEAEKKDFTNKLWLANSNPEKFDFVYKDFSLNTIKNWGIKIKFEDPNFEPNPYLAKWTLTGDDFLYWHWATSEILTYLKLMGYGEESVEVQKSLKHFLHLKKYRLLSPKTDEHPHDYLSRINAQLKPKGYSVLVSNNGYHFTVCKTEEIDNIIKIFDQLRWAFIET